MILWFKDLPPKTIDFTEWRPFIRNDWFREHYMKFVYLLMIGILFLPNLLGGHSFSSVVTTFIEEELKNSQLSTVGLYVLIILLIAAIFIIHELLHILVIYKQGDISLTHRGIFFWLNTNAILSKKRFWIFMSLPVLVLSGVPAVTSIYLTGYIKSLVLFICWFNLIISSSDIINSVLILSKPNKTKYCRGYYR